MVECQLCGESFKFLTWRHLKYSHDMSIDEYLSIFPGTSFVSIEMKEEISDTLRGRDFTEEHRKNLSEGDSRRWEDPSQREDRSIMMENLWKTKEYIDSTIDGLYNKPETSEETRKRTSDSLTKFHNSEEGIRTSQEVGRKNKIHWTEKDFLEKIHSIRGGKKNTDEEFLEYLLEENFPGEWKFVGDFQVGIGGRIPDFIYIGDRKLVIELFSTYWHLEVARTEDDELDRIEHYRKFGYECLVIWSNYIYIKDFVATTVSKFLRRPNVIS